MHCAEENETSVQQETTTDVPDSVSRTHPEADVLLSGELITQVFAGPAGELLDSLQPDSVI